MFRHDSKNSFSRPANVIAYAAAQLVANSTAAGSVAALEIPIMDRTGSGAVVLDVRMWKSTTNITNASFRVHLFATQPTVANGDGGAFNPNNVANKLGYFDIASMEATSDGATGRSDSTKRITVGNVSGKHVASVWVLVEARGAYSPGSGETIGVALDTYVEQA